MYSILSKLLKNLFKQLEDLINSLDYRKSLTSLPGGNKFLDLNISAIKMNLKKSTVKTRFYRHGGNLERSRIPPWRYKSGAEIFFLKFIYTTPAI